MEQCGDGVIDASSDVIALGFRLGTNTAKRLPAMGLNLFQDPAMQKAISDALSKEGKRLVEAQRKNQPITNADGIKVLGSVGKSVGTSAQKWAMKEIEKSSDYKALEKSLKNLECSFKKSPVGVFIDENRGLLIVFASGLAIGGAAAMYTARSGDWVGSQLAEIASKPLRFKLLGNLEIGAEKIEFKPSDRVVEVTTFTAAKWKAVKTSLNLNIGFKEDALAKTSATGEVIIDVAKSTSLIGKGMIGYMRPKDPWHQSLNYNLGLGLKFDEEFKNSKLKLQVRGYVTQEPTQRSMGGAGDLTLGITGGGSSSPGVNLNLGFKGGRTRTFMPTGQDTFQNMFETKLGVEVTF